MTTRLFRGRNHGRGVQRKACRPRVEAVEARLLLSTFTVSTTSDSGAGSLRQAIMDSNASTTPSVIDFEITGGGAQTIIPVTALPAITNPVTIDATTETGYSGTPLVQINGSQIFFANTTPPNSVRIPGVDGLTIQAGNTTVKGLAINRFTGDGIAIEGNGRNVIVGNYIGTDLTGLDGLGNGQDGVFVTDSRNNVIGGTTAGSGNLISANGGSGVELTSSRGHAVTGGNLVEGTLIGTDATGAGDLGNTFDGVTINTSNNNTIGGLAPGAANTIAFNGGDGVKAGNFNFNYFSGQTFTTILSNSIYANAALGIELDFGASDPVESAALTSAFPSGSGTTVEGSLRGNPLTTYRVQFFSNAVPDPSGAGQGQTLIGSESVTTDTNGLGSISVTLPGSIGVGQSLSATATGPSNDTSPFFANTTVAPAATADLAQIQRSTHPAVTAGNTVTYGISVSNLGPSNATGVVLTDTLPTGLVASSIQTTLGTATQANGVVTVSMGDMPAGDVEGVVITVVTTTPGTIDNKVTVSGDQTDPNPRNNTSTLPVGVVVNPNPLVITGGRLLVGLNTINGILLNFNQPLEAAQATNPINYTLLGLNPKGQFTVDVPLNRPLYNQTALTVKLTPTKPLALGKIYQLEVDGTGSAGLTNPAGSLLVGNTSAGPLGPWYWQISRGYLTPNPTTPSKPVKAAGQVRLVESVTTRRVLSGPATRTANGTVVNNLPPLVETTTGATNTLNTH